ncbi:MAG: hypothetical protein ABSC95_02035 [Acetobacteraceae bacterium]|jgi:hypothetical protein
MAGAARAALDAAAALARTGDRQRAREHCAAVIFEAQPLIAAQAELLRAALYALLTAHGFRLLSRLVLAMSGTTLQVEVLPACAGPIAPPRQREEPGRTIYTLDPRWLDRLSPDDMFLRHWCDALVAQPHRHADAPGIAPVARHLEPV